MISVYLEWKVETRITETEKKGNIYNVKEIKKKFLIIIGNLEWNQKKS